jgi:hypothetical protein
MMHLASFLVYFTSNMMRVASSKMQNPKDTKGKKHHWTEEEVAIVEKGISSGDPPKEIASKLPHIPYKSVKSKCDHLRASKKQKVESSNALMVAPSSALVPTGN